MSLLTKNVIQFTFSAFILTLLTACGGGTSNPAVTDAVSTDSVALAIVNGAPTSSCGNGGITVQTGADKNKNQVLEPTEASNAQYVCSDTNSNSETVISNSSASLVPTNFQAQISIKPEVPGNHCATGGSLVSVGMDTNRNSILDASEVTSLSYICNGSPGLSGASGTSGSDGINGLNSLFVVVAEPAGVNCSLGGSKATAGKDANRNDILDAAEVSSTTYICAGASGATGATGAAGANGLPGVAGLKGADGLPGATGATGGVVSAYAYIYNLKEQIVKQGEPVFFDSHSVVSGVVHESEKADITVLESGTYIISFSISALESNQFALFINYKENEKPVPVPGSVYGSEAGTSQNSGKIMLELSARDTMTLRNFNSKSDVTLTSLFGGTEANVNASISIQRLN